MDGWVDGFVTQCIGNCWVQVESAMAVQTLKPRIDLIKARYGEDKDRVQAETSKLYEEAGVNPAAGEQLNGARDCFVALLPV